MKYGPCRSCNFHETKSAAILIKALKEEGFEVQEGVDGIPTAFIGTWGSGKPVIGIRVNSMLFPA